jgi:hypothetical protein
MLQATSSACPHFLPVALSDSPVTCRCCLNIQWWPASGHFTSLHCFLSKACRPLGCLLKCPLIKSFDCLLPDVAAKCLEYFSCSHSLNLSLPAHFENTNYVFFLLFIMLTFLSLYSL